VQQFLLYLQEFNTVSIVVRLLLSVILSGFIGFERSRREQAAGLRTHILVCLGATIASMTGLYINATYGGTGDVTRIAAQVVSGIGFLGAGTIIVRNHNTVTGLTTSACVWAVGAIGIAIGYGFYLAAVVGSLLIMFITNTLSKLDKKVRIRIKSVSIYVEFAVAKQLNATLEEIGKSVVEIGELELVKPKTNAIDGVGAEMILHINKKQEVGPLISKINDMENVLFAIVIRKY
jgi:putative Mg2+ transporter-C (MgtC) family protein